METLELPQPIYDALLHAARESQTTPAEWIMERLRQSRVAVAAASPLAVTTDESLFAFSGAVKSGRVASAENKAIDADLYR